MDDVNLKSSRLRSQWNELHLSALLREQTCRPLPRFWLKYGMEPYGPLDWKQPLGHIDLDELVKRWPRTVNDRIDRTLCNLASLSRHGGDHVTINSTSDNALAFAQNIGESLFHTRALADLGYVEIRCENGNPNREITLRPQGWARVEQLTRGKSDRHHPVFVAMWFGGSAPDTRQVMDNVFKDGIYLAIRRAGYEAVRSDIVEHNDWIMDKILGDIRIAPFVVADFTGHTNGVYLEAGFARGLGSAVIHTCREDHFKQAHFDTRQLNHVLWNTTEELCSKLYHRIVGTIGIGPYPPLSNSIAQPSA